MHTSTRTLGDALYERLLTLEPAVRVYRGLVGYRVVGGVVTTETPPAYADSRVMPHAVLYGAAGLDTPMDIGGVHRSLDWPFQVTIAAGYPHLVEEAVDLVRSLMSERFQIPGLTKSQVFEDGFTGTTQVDQTVQPARFYLPLQFRLTATPQGDPT